MGYRPNIVKRYEVEYGSEIGGFNYDPQGLDNFFFFCFISCIDSAIF